MNRFAALVLASLFLLQSAAYSVPRAYQDPDSPPMANADVVRMVKAKVAPDVIVAKIENSRCHFDTQAGVLAELRYNGVPDAVLMAMVKAPYGAPAKKPDEWKNPVRDPETTPTGGVTRHGPSNEYASNSGGGDWKKMGSSGGAPAPPSRTGPTRG